MSGHAATRPVEGSQAVFERIQVSVLPIAGKHAPSVPSSPPMDKCEDADLIVRSQIYIQIDKIGGILSLSICSIPR